MPLVYHRAPDLPIASRITEVPGATRGELRRPQGLRVRSRLAVRGAYGGATRRNHCPKCLDRVSRSPGSILRGPNSASWLALRQYRVSHLGVHAAQEARHLARRDRRRRGPRPGRVHVVLVVGAGHGPVPPPPPPAARCMALLLTRGRPAGPLPPPDAGIRTKEGLAEGTPAATWSAGHRSPPRWKAPQYPMRTAPAQVGCAVVGWTERRLASCRSENPEEFSPARGYRRAGAIWPRRRRCGHIGTLRYFSSPLRYSCRATKAR
jgi:hypothetical protein